MPVGTVVSGVEDTVAAVTEIRKSAKDEVIWIVHPSLLTLSFDYDILELAKRFIRDGGVIRGVTTISRDSLDTVRAVLNIGEDVRHSDSLSEVFMYIGDLQHSISSINVGVNEYMPGTPLICFRSDDPTYAEYLLTSFENAWAYATPAEKRIQELGHEARQS